LTMRLEGVFRFPLLFGIKFGELLAYLLVALGNGLVFYHFLLYHQSVRIYQVSEYPELFAKTMGQIICFNFAVLLVLPQRNSIWVPLLSISMERMIKYHRIMGRVVFISITIHMGLFWYSWISKHRIWSAPPDNTYAFMLTSIIGHAAWLCVLVILITSFEYFRRRFFNVFYYAHHLFVPLAGLAVYHSYLTQKWRHDMLLYWLLPGIFLYLIDLIIRTWRARGKVQCIAVVEGPDIMLVKLVKRNFHFTPGQYVYLNFPQISHFEWHPFSIISAPSESPTRDTEFTVAIRNMGPNTWSGKVTKLFQNQLLTRSIAVRVEGPYGVLSIDIYQYPVLVLIAGGIGIAPLISILIEHHNNPSVTYEKLYFLWSAKQQDYLPHFANTLQVIEENDLLGKIEMLRYTTRDRDSMLNRSFSSLEASQHGLSLSGRLTNSVPEFNNGRPKFKEFFSQLTSQHPKSSIGVVVCGPRSMAQEVSSLCQYYNRKRGPPIHIHCENFEV